MADDAVKELTRDITPSELTLGEIMGTDLDNDTQNEAKPDLAVVVCTVASGQKRYMYSISTTDLPSGVKVAGKETDFVCGKTTILYAFDIKHATRYPMEEAKLKMHYWEWFNNQADWDDDGAGIRSYKVIPVNK